MLFIMKNESNKQLIQWSRNSIKIDYQIEWNNAGLQAQLDFVVTMEMIIAFCESCQSKNENIVFMDPQICAANLVFILNLDFVM